MVSDLTLANSLLPGVVTGMLAIMALLTRGVLRCTAPDVLLALVVSLPTVSVLLPMLYYLGWANRADDYGLLFSYMPVFDLAVGPAYFLYFRSLTNQDFRWWPAARHLLPAAVQLAATAAAAAYDLGWRRAEVVLAPDGAGYAGPAMQMLQALDEHRLLSLVSLALLLYYSLRVRTEYRRYRRYLNDNFSNQERLRFEGLRDLLVLQVAGLSIGLAATGLAVVGHMGPYLAGLAYLLRSLLIYGLAAVGLQANYAAATSPLVFDPDEIPADAEPVSGPAGVPELAPVMATAGSAGPDAAPATTPVEAAMEADAADGAAHPAAPATLPGLAPELLPWRDKLLRLMTEQEPWREPELNLTELAQRLKLHPAQLSKVLNAGCGQHFSDFINGYRLREALRLLADPARAHYSLVGVALESGFNSKSTFNRVFKSQLGYPPSEVPRPKM